MEKEVSRIWVSLEKMVEMKQEETGEEEETVGGEEDESDVDEEETVEDEQGPSGSSKFDTVKEEIEELDRSIPKVEDEPEITVCRDDYSRKEPAKICGFSLEPWGQVAFREPWSPSGGPPRCHGKHVGRVCQRCRPGQFPLQRWFHF